MAKTILGIDPGASGAIVRLDSDGKLLECIKMPETPMDILNSLKTYDTATTVCYIEDVGKGMPGQSSKATATFARHNGYLEMALLALGISSVYISPRKWQKHLGLGSKKGEEKKDHKNRIKAWSQRTFPATKVTLANADALAIAYYGYTNEK